MKKILIGLVAAAGIFLLQKYHVLDLLKPGNIDLLRKEISSFGSMGPLVFIGFFALATVLFVPGLPITFLAGVLFGPIKGGICVVAGSSIGVSAAFLLARYLGRDLVEGWTKRNDKMSKLDSYIKDHGNTILIISRLVPIFPFNLQNYAYGITNISFRVYFIYSLIFMVPATFIYTGFGALAYSSLSLDRLVLYSGLLLTSLCLLIVIPKKIFKLSSESKEEQI